VNEESDDDDDHTQLMRLCMQLELRMCIIWDASHQLQHDRPIGSQFEPPQPPGSKYVSYDPDGFGILLLPSEKNDGPVEQGGVVDKLAILDTGMYLLLTTNKQQKKREIKGVKGGGAGEDC